MSTVLWANSLQDGQVRSDTDDKYALYKFLDKLDAICRKQGVTLISEACDSTDLEFNMDDQQLPEGMESTDDLMARSGTWIDAEEAVKMFETLIDTIEAEGTKFGVLKDHCQDVISELKESLDFARHAVERGARFNFSIVM